MKTKSTALDRLVVKPIVRKPRIAVIQGEVSTTSMALAEHFGKRHDNVLQYIEAQIAEMPKAFRKLNFQVTLRNVNGPNGAVRSEKYVRMTRDGFVLIAMGFGGKEAMKWKVAYIASLPPNPIAIRTKPSRDIRMYFSLRTAPLGPFTFRNVT